MPVPFPLLPWSKKKGLWERDENELYILRNRGKETCMDIQFWGVLENDIERPFDNCMFYVKIVQGGRMPIMCTCDNKSEL